MKEKINQNLHWVIAFLLIVCILVMITLLSQARIIDISQTFAFMTSPFVPISAIATINAIQDFAGKEFILLDHWFYVVYVILTATFLFMLCTYVLAKGVQQTENLSNSNKNRPFFWYTGVVLVSMSLLLSSISLINGIANFSKMQESSNVSALSDDARLTLTNLAFEASSKMMSPLEAGGGNGSFEGFKSEDGSTRMISLEDLQSYNPQSGFTYEIKKGTSDKTIEIFAYIDYQNPEIADKVKVKEGTTSKQLKMIVSPFEDNIFTLR